MTAWDTRQGSGLANHRRTPPNRVIRGEDMLFRIGGDEFAIITKMVREEEGAISLAERLMFTISGQQIEQGGRKIQVGASIGIAYDDGAMSADDLIRNADLAMYDAKRAGKHCYRCYRDILASAAFTAHAAGTGIAGSVATAAI